MRLWDMVLQQQNHSCTHMRNGCSVQGRCKYRFPYAPHPQRAASINEEGRLGVLFVLARMTMPGCCIIGVLIRMCNVRLANTETTTS